MNTVAWVTGVAASLGLTLFGFNNLGNALLGLVGIALVLWCIGHMLFGIQDDLDVFFGGRDRE